MVRHAYSSSSADDERLADAAELLASTTPRGVKLFVAGNAPLLLRVVHVVDLCQVGGASVAEETGGVHSSAADDDMGISVTDEQAALQADW